MIRVSTQDTVNFGPILEHLTGEEPIYVHPATTAKIRKHPESNFFWGMELSSNPEELYRFLQESDKTFILVNSTEDNGVSFDAGVVPTPPDMVLEMVGGILDTEQANGLLSVLGGLTLKEVGEMSSITMARDHSLTAEGMIATRKMCVTTLRGIEQVDTALPTYFANNQLEEWLDINGNFFLDPIDERLVSRGILLYGDSGVGKTTGAKRIAGMLNIPLYRLDLSSMMTKWLGESESHLSAALSQVDIEHPAVLLIDEVEKVFQQEGVDGGSTTRMLSQLLWWLQEHQSKILTVMTTNNMDILPPELYRPGRVDTCIEMVGLMSADAVNMADMLLATFKSITALHASKIRSDVLFAAKDKKPGPISHAVITQLVYGGIKKYFI